MRFAAALVVFVGLLAGCPRHHDPPNYQPSFHEPVLPPPTPPPVAPPPAPWPPPLASPGPGAAGFPSAAPPPPPGVGVMPDGGAGLLELRGSADGGTVNGDPRGPRAEVLEAVVRSAAPALKRCVDAGPLPTGVDIPVRVVYRILPVGRVGLVDVEGQLPPDVTACVKSVIEGLRFPPFEGAPVSSALPFRFRRDVVPAR